MWLRSIPLRIGVAGLALSVGGAAWSADIAPNRALYRTELSSAKQESGVVGAEGTMAVESGETCDGWTVEEHDRLTMHYAEEGDVEVLTNFVSWESKDGLRFRFSEREMKNGKVDREVSGEAKLEEGKGGKVEFVRPDKKTMDLAPGVLFPTAHTIRLLERAAAGEQFVAAKVLDGTSVENAADVTAVIGARQNPPSTKDGLEASPLLQRPSWRMHLAFFPADATVDKPEYELDMKLLDNGISRDMVLDYGDFAVKAKLEKLEPLPKPNC